MPSQRVYAFCERKKQILNQLLVDWILELIGICSTPLYIDDVHSHVHSHVNANIRQLHSMFKHT